MANLNLGISPYQTNYVGGGSALTPTPIYIDTDTGDISGIGILSVEEVSMIESVSGGPVQVYVRNNSNTAASTALLSLITGGTSAGDPYAYFAVAGGSNYSMGIDNSASDIFGLWLNDVPGTSPVYTVNPSTLVTAFAVGVSFAPVTATGAAAGPVICNARQGLVTFTSVSIAAAADLTLTITNNQIAGAGTQVLCNIYGATTGSALSIKSVTASAGSVAIVVTNGTGATTSTANIGVQFSVVT